MAPGKRTAAPVEADLRMIQSRVTPDLHERIKAKARAEFLTVSQLVRKLCSQACDASPNNP